MKLRALQCLFIGGVLFAGGGCRRPTSTPNSAVSKAPMHFVPVAKDAGISFVHNSGAFGARWLPETMGAGVAWLDYNGDGWQDLLFVNGRDWTESEVREYVEMIRTNASHKSPSPDEVWQTWRAREKRHSTPVLYRNDHRGGFVDVTTEVGLDFEMYGMGACAGDFDNDGDADIYLTAWGPNRLLRNDGGKFADITSRPVECPGFSSSATWLDYDRDGDLDLFVCNYVRWRPRLDVWCTLDKKTKSYCTPRRYFGESCRLLRNDYDHFTDVTESAGVANPDGKSLGVVAFDFDQDGWLDLAVANDTEEDLLWRNLGDGTFEEIGVVTGMAVDDNGQSRAGMGIDAGDYDNSGRESLVIGNFSNEMLGLYHNEGEDFFDAAPGSGVGAATRLVLTFSSLFCDLDNDGWLDIFGATGHIDPEWGKVEKNVTYAQRPLLLHNIRGQRFRSVGQQAGFTSLHIARGAACADYDLDGDLDLAISTNNGPGLLYRNDSPGQNHWLRVRLEGDGEHVPRDAIGSRVTVVAGGIAHGRAVRAGAGYCSQSELPLTFGLGAATVIDNLFVAWPDGATTTRESLRVDREVTVRYGR